ncbi:MAG: hypothetical protein LCH88_09130 [Proteobacteria bacterium]|nr:hypothetical protein [Pseudomonadota bacterium]
MSDNNLADAGTADAQPLAQDQSDDALIARFLEDETVDDDQTVAKDRPAETDDQQSPKSDEDEDVLFAEEDGATKDGDKDKAGEPALGVTLGDGTKATPAQIQEWRDGALRQADYSRKTQELAEHRRGLEDERTRVRTHETHVSQALDRALAVLSRYLPPEPSRELAFTDPIEFTRQKAIYDGAMADIGSIVSEKSDLEAKTKAETERETQAQRTTRLQAEWDALTGHLPQLKDPAKNEALIGRLASTLDSYGFDKGTISQIEDHRMFLVIADAARYRQMQAQKSQQPGKTPPVGSPPAKRPQGGTNFREQVKRAQQSGSDQALMDTLAARFND